MADPFIIAEAAQGYEGDPGIARLLVRAAAAAGADAVKFQIVFADDLAAPGYKYFELFEKLEMAPADWRSIRDLAGRLGLGFYADVLGPRSFDLAGKLDLDGVKISTTCFFETALADRIVASGVNILLSVGGIGTEDAKSFIDRYRLAARDDVTLLYGYQAEPTPTERTNLLRIPALRDELGLDVGFMDHADGTGDDPISLSAMAMALGVTLFEKHITLDRALELEDHVSALPPAEFATYVAALKRLSGALGNASITPIAEELAYAEAACKRVVAARDLTAGTTLSEADIALLRPAEPGGLLRAEDAIGRTLNADIARHGPVNDGNLR